MKPEVLPIDREAARRLLDELFGLAANSQDQVLAHVAELLARHRYAFLPGPLARKLEDARTALILSGTTDMELLKRLKDAADFARNLTAAAPRKDPAA